MKDKLEEEEKEIQAESGPQKKKKEKLFRKKKKDLLQKVHYIDIIAFNLSKKFLSIY